MKKKSIKSLINRYANIISLLSFFISFILSCFCLTSTKDYLLEMLCNDLTHPREQTPGEIKPSLISFKFNDPFDESFDLYEPLFYTYVYNATVSRDSIITDTNIELTLNNASYSLGFSELSVRMVSQFLFNEVKTNDSSENKYILRHGKFACYLPISVSTNGANEFAFISDLTAEKWISELGDYRLGIIESDTNSDRYLKLINFLKDNNLYYIYDRSGEAIFSITNVYYSDFGSAPRLCELYDDFIISYALCHKSTKYTFDFHYELETHVDTFGNKQILKTVNNYYGSKINTSFYVPNENNNSFIFDQNLTTRYKDIIQNNKFQIGYIFVAITLIFYFVCVFYLSKKLNNFSKIKIFIPHIVLWLFYGILATYLYFYSGFGVVFVFQIIIFVLSSWKEGMNGKDNFKTIKFERNSREAFYDKISI